jgi:diphthamide synthase (EF-2-diphthine--ammonia ligase)
VQRKLFSKKPKQQVTFEWAGKVGEYQFEVTEDPTFKKVRVKKKVKRTWDKVNFSKDWNFLLASKENPSEWESRIFYSKESDYQKSSKT